MTEPTGILPPDRATVLAECERILQQELESPAPLQPDATLAAWPELDSIGLIVLIVALEDRFRVILNQSDAAAIVPFADLADLIVRRAAEPPLQPARSRPDPQEPAS